MVDKASVVFRRMLMSSAYVSPKYKQVVRQRELRPPKGRFQWWKQ
uniref:Mobile element protein n=1 Tax=Syphacia muris TaxID=451379 RepID=A0A0N5B1L6_9BILA